MKRVVFSTVVIFYGLFLINNLTSSLSRPKDGSVELNNQRWQGIDNMQMKDSYSTFDFHFSWNKFITHTIFLDKRIEALENGKSVLITDLYEEGVDDNIPDIPKNNIFRLNEVIYSHKKESSGLYTYPDKKNYYNQTIHLEFTESFPVAIKRMFSNHYVYFCTDSSQLIAYKLNILPYDSLWVHMILVFLIFGVFIYLSLAGIEFLLGLLLGVLYSFILSAVDSIPVIFTAGIIMIFFISSLVGFKVKMWSVNRKVFTVPVIIVYAILYLSVSIYMYLYNVRLQVFVERTRIYNICVILFLSVFVSGYFIYDVIRLYRIIALLFFGQKIQITDLKVNSAYIKTYRRSFPNYFISVNINNQAQYTDINCTKRTYTKYENSQAVEGAVIYFSKNGDMIIL